MANANTIERKWYVIDAEGKTLGRLASEVAAILRGKNKPTFTPHVDTGDHVIILNASKVELTGKKLTDNWTVLTVDVRRCAHFEHTVVITETGFEILTRS
jgi:ribosomal protein L13